jgi:choice-of-anchor C domain-containing protein
MNTKRVLILLAVTGSFLFATRAGHASLITNGSFENGPIFPSSFADLGPGSSGIAGWTIGGDSVDLVGAAWQASNGNFSLDLSGNSAGSVSQVLTTTAGQSYTILFDLAANPSIPNSIKTVEVSAAATVQDYTFDAANHTPTSMGWTTESFVFTATGTSTTLTFTSLVDTPWGPALDNVRSVPEPSAFAVSLTLFGIFGAVALQKRRAATECRDGEVSSR